tara:strand:- start:17 stop:868 length:852 start_codon:yes stop_codon:yes gene_type:complete
MEQDTLSKSFNKIPTVLPVKADVPNPKILPVHPNMIQPPSLFLCVASIRGGKTTLLNSLVFQDRASGFYDAQTYFDNIIIMSNTINNDPCGRFLKKACNVTDHYNDGMIAEFVRNQKAFGERDEMPFTAMFLDDILSKNLKRNSEISFLATRMRHLNIGLLGIFVQQLKAVDTIIRNNCTDVIIMKQPNNKQLIACYEEWGGQFGDIKNFMKIYKYATAEPFSFLYLKVRDGLALKSFEKVIAQGDKLLFDGSTMGDIDAELKNTQIKTEKEVTDEINDNFKK